MPSPPHSSPDRLQHAERYLSAAGSDCGIANINLGTSGAEIGGAFGGEEGYRAAGASPARIAWKGVHAAPNEYHQLEP